MNVEVRLDLIRIRWIVRVGGTVAIVVGLTAFFSVFASLLYRIPVLGRMVRRGVGLVAVSIGVPFALPSPSHSSCPAVRPVALGCLRPGI